MLPDGKRLMPWQQRVLDVGTEVMPDGSWAYRTIIVTVQRQAGKTTLLGPKNVHRCLIRRDAKTWLTAQTRQDARDTWADIAKMVARSPLANRVDARRSNGSEELSFPTGSTFRVFAPTEASGHGKANESVDVDEAWAFDAEQGAALEQAVIPTFTTTGGQLWIVSTAGTVESAWLRDYVDRGRDAVDAGRRDTIAYFEWSLDDEQVLTVTAGLDPDATDKERAAAFEAILSRHPAHGHTMRVDVLEQAVATMAPGEVVRAYGNVWTATVDRVIPEHLWLARKASKWQHAVGHGATIALGFDVAIDRSDAAIIAAWRDHPAAPMRVEVVDHRPGDAWLADRVVELRDTWRPLAVGHDDSGPARDVGDELRRRGVELVSMNAREMATGCAAFLSAIRNGRFEHHGQPALDDAVEVAAQRPLGDGWAWARRTSAGSIAPLTAATVAMWAYDHRPTPAARPVIATRRRKIA